MTTTISIASDNLKRIDFRDELVAFLKIYLAIKPLQFFYKANAVKINNKLQSLPKGTIGSELYKLLNDESLKVIPKFESHDLKHIILGYGMTSIEEIKMQAYLFGNGNKSIFCFLFLASGLIFPESWSSFYKEFKKGKKTVSIGDLSFDKTIEMKTEVLKSIYTRRCK